MNNSSNDQLRTTREIAIFGYLMWERVPKIIEYNEKLRIQIIKDLPWYKRLFNLF